MAVSETSGLGVQAMHFKPNWLLSNALFVAFTISIRLRKEYNDRANMTPQLVCRKFEHEIEILATQIGLAVMLEHV